MNVTSPTTANAQLTIANNATSGPRNVTVATGVQLGTLPNGFTAPAPTLQSIAVTPANPSIGKGLTQQFTATGTYSDSSTQNLTSQVTWASATPAVATINTTGLATAVNTGTSTISATLGAVTGSTVLTVTNVIPTLIEQPIPTLHHWTLLLLALGLLLLARKPSATRTLPSTHSRGPTHRER